MRKDSFLQWLTSKKSCAVASFNSVMPATLSTNIFERYFSCFMFTVYLMTFIFEMHEQIASYLHNFTSDERDDDEEEEEEERLYGRHRHEYEDEEVGVNPRDTGRNLNERETFRRSP